MDGQAGSDEGEVGPVGGPPGDTGRPSEPQSGDGGGRDRRPAIAGVIIAAVVLVAGLVFVTQRDDNGATTLPVQTDAPTTVVDVETTVTTLPPETTTLPPETTTTLPPETTTTTNPGFVQGPGEIFLEPTESVGPEPFTGEVFGGETTTTSAPPITAPPAGEAAGPTEVSSVVGDTPALYGGSRNNAVCDKDAQLRFLQEHPDKAAAFVEALNGDPSLEWQGGSSLTVAQLPDYWRELTPMVLTRDTRVTNHGFRDGRPTSRQVVLQAGTAVLVDAYGVPRARCLCGNPLTRPQPVQSTPVYTGTSWPDFRPETIIVINQTTVIIDVFVLVDIVTGEEFVRPAGTAGTDDAFRQASIWRVDVTSSLAEVDYFNTTTATWSADLTIGDDGTIVGSGAGTWTFDADCYRADGSIQSTSSAQGTYTVSVVGQTTVTELGRFVNVTPSYAGFAITSYGGSPPSAECEQDIYEHAESWVAPAFGPFDAQAEGDVVAVPYESNGFVGEATLTPFG